MAMAKAGRRGNGEGTVYQLADGRWRYQATIAGRRVGGYAKTRKEAQTNLRQLHGDADRGLLPPAERVTVAQHFARWLADEVKHTRKPRTYDSYSDTARLYILPALGHLKLIHLQPSHLQQLYATLLDRGLSARTVGIVHSTLHCALEQAVEWNLIPRNVTSIAKAPRVRRKEVEAFSDEQVRRLQEAAKGTRWEALISLALASGMRQGELLGVKWSDLDLEAGVVYVRRQLGHDKVLAEQKNDRNRRSIDLPASCIRVLRQHRSAQAEQRRLLGGEYEHLDLLFATYKGRPLGFRNVFREYKKLLQRTELPDYSFHALRHTNATLLLLQGVHPKVVQERLGHSSITITLDTYSHVLPRLGKSAAEKLDGLLI